MPYPSTFTNFSMKYTHPYLVAKKYQQYFRLLKSFKNPIYLCWLTPLADYESGAPWWNSEQIYTSSNVFVGVIIISTIKHVTNSTVATFATILLKYRQNGVISKKLNSTKHSQGPDYAIFYNILAELHSDTRGGGSV